MGKPLSSKAGWSSEPTGTDTLVGRGGAGWAVASDVGVAVGIGGAGVSVGSGAVGVAVGGTRVSVGAGAVGVTAGDSQATIAASVRAARMQDARKAAVGLSKFFNRPPTCCFWPLRGCCAWFPAFSSPWDSG